MDGENLSGGIFSDSETENSERFDLASAYFEEMLANDGEFFSIFFQNFIFCMSFFYGRPNNYKFFQILKKFLLQWTWLSWKVN